MKKPLAIALGLLIPLCIVGGLLAQTSETFTAFVNGSPALTTLTGAEPVAGGRKAMDAGDELASCGADVVAGAVLRASGQGQQLVGGQDQAARGERVELVIWQLEELGEPGLLLIGEGVKIRHGVVGPSGWLLRGRGRLR